MTLQEFIEQSSLTQRALAEKLNIGFRYLNGIIKGYYIPSRQLALKIEKLSQGKVSAQELLFPIKIQPVEKT